MKGKCDGKEDQGTEGDDNATPVCGKKDGTVEGESTRFSAE